MKLTNNSNKSLIEDSMIEPSRPAFKSAGSAPHVRPAVSYTQASQMTRFTELLQSEIEAEKYLFPGSFLARGHLSPDGDGIFRSWAFTTYFFVNAAPKWQVVNNGNWLRVENVVRLKASLLQEDLEIFTGTFGVLTLNDVHGNKVEMSLETGGIEVPKWFWKIIQRPAADEGIAFVTLNNPFVRIFDESERICKDVCIEYGWYQEAFDNFARGYTYCCAVEELMEIVRFIPEEASCAHILQF